MANFNSRPCERGDLAYEADELGVGAFQFSPLREGRLAVNDRRGGEDKFQFSPLREGRRTICRGALQHTQFQFSPLREGRLLRMGQLLLRAVDFNSRPCERGDVDFFTKSLDCYISIPAPARGATVYRVSCIR